LFSIFFAQSAFSAEFDYIDDNPEVLSRYENQLVNNHLNQAISEQEFDAIKKSLGDVLKKEQLETLTFKEDANRAHFLLSALATQCHISPSLNLKLKRKCKGQKGQDSHKRFSIFFPIFFKALNQQLVDKLCYCNVFAAYTSDNIQDEIDDKAKQSKNESHKKFFNELWTSLPRLGEINAARETCLNWNKTIAYKEVTCCYEKPITKTKELTEYLEEEGIVINKLNEEELIIIYLLFHSTDITRANPRIARLINQLMCECESYHHGEYFYKIVNVWFKTADEPGNDRRAHCVCSILDPNQGYLSLTSKKPKNPVVVSSETFEKSKCIVM